MRAYRRRAIEGRDEKAFHKMRLALKRLRYTAEIFQPALPRLGEGLMGLLGKFQTYMGDIHDLDVLAENIREVYAEEAPGDVRRVLRRLSQQREGILDQFKRSFVRMEKDNFWMRRQQVQK
jgi:CHAD domain-containing protein